MLSIAAILIFALGVAHSVLGERYILTRLLSRTDLPKLFGGTAFTAGTLRFAWHITTITWFGLAAILWQLGRGASTPLGIAQIIGVTSLACGVLPIVFTRGRHVSWVVFFAIGVLALCWSGG